MVRDRPSNCSGRFGFESHCHRDIRSAIASPAPLIRGTKEAPVRILSGLRLFYRRLSNAVALWMLQVWLKR